MSEPWVVDAEGRLVVNVRLGRAARLLGLPFAAVGFYLAWNVLAAIVVTIREAPREILTFIPGWLIGTVMTAAFLVPGWLLLTLRKRTIVDRAKRQVIDVKDFLAYRHSKTHALGAAPVVKLARSVTRSNDSGNTPPVYSVELVIDGGREVLIWLADAPDEARDVGRRFALLINATVDDRLDAPHPSEEDEEEESSTASQTN